MTSTKQNTKIPDGRYRRLNSQEIIQLENQRCYCSDWTRVLISNETEIDLLLNVSFEGDIRIGALQRVKGAKLEDVKLVNVTLGDNVAIEKTNLIEFTPGAKCGIGTEVGVLDETGSRAVRIYPHLSAQIATIMAREAEWTERMLKDDINRHINNFEPPHEIGAYSEIRHCGTLINVSVGNNIPIIGATNLRNGIIINNATPERGIAEIGAGVDAEDFIIEDGAVRSGAIVRRCFIGQGAVIEKGFTAHDSLFFANCSMENGEACALFAGPYTVSMHKSTLLIGCQTSFMNAGSGTNQSNHMYKVGPVHCGIMERGVKTSSGSYLMLGARIGAFSLLMGQHKTHPDSSKFPFSYLFGDDRGATIVTAGAMLKSCGMMRDEKKWPARDRRIAMKIPLYDRIVFPVFNPMTVDAMENALTIIESLQNRPSDIDRFVRYKGMKFMRGSLEKARNLYELAIYKYLHTHHKKLLASSNSNDINLADKDPHLWLDLAGLIMPRSMLEQIMKTTSINSIEEICDKAFQQYESMELEWIKQRFKKYLDKGQDFIAEKAAQFDCLVEEDQQKTQQELSNESDMLRL